MTLPYSRNEQVQWFHTLAELPDEALVQWAGAKGSADFIAFVQQHLPSAGVPSYTGPRELASTVRSLRENERAWNHALTRALVEADDLFKRRAQPEAGAILLKFAAQCPWQLFKEVAENQSSYYRSPGRQNE